jgi:Flp pilus assembly protein TadD
MPWKTIVSVSLFVMAIISFWNDFFGLRERLFPPKREPVVLSSERVNLGSGSRKAVDNFLVRNIGEIDLYQVTIKLTLNSPALSITNDDIWVEMMDHPSNAEMSLPISGDPYNQLLFAQHGFLVPGRDTSGHEALWVVIDHLPPKASAGFRIRNQSFGVLPPGEHFLLASVPFYTNVLPSSYMVGDDSTVVMFPKSDMLGVESIGPGTIKIIASAHIAQIDGGDIVTNADTLLMAGKLDEAEKEYTRAIQRNPFLGVAYGNRSIVLLMKGRIQDAYQDSSKALSLLPDSPLAYAHVAQCHQLFGRLDESLTNYTKAISLAGTNMPSLVYERGVVLTKLNRMVDARTDFDQAVLLGFTNEWVRYFRGIAFFKENSISNAITEFTAALAMRPDMAYAHFARGLAFGALNQFSDADRDLREAIRLRPSFANTLNTIKKANQVPENTAHNLADPQH